MRRAARRTARRSVRRRSRRRRRRRRRRIILLSGGMVALGHRKMRKEDVDRIEEYSGQPAEDMTDEELDQAMNDLGIEGQKLDEQDQTYIDPQGGEEGSEPVSSTAPAGEPDYINELERLAHLRDQGIITDEEFEMKKNQLLGL